MMATASVGAVLRDLKTRVAGIATVLVSRNGVVLFADLPENVISETFSIMCATIFGAATTANSELNRARPERILIEGRDSKAIIVGSGANALLVAVVDGSADSERTFSEAAKFADLLRSLPHDPVP